VRQRLIWVAIAALVGAGAATVVRAGGVFPMRVTSNSMAPTIERGDWIVVRRLGESERDEIGRSDIVLFRYPFGSSLRAVKRAVAVGGDSVTVTRRFVRVNGRTIPVSGDPALYATPLPRYTPLVRGDVFVVGDNPSGSIDSRTFGAVPRAEIVGRVWFVFATPDWLMQALVAAGALGLGLGGALLAARK
jgi:signal peptidase I